MNFPYYSKITVPSWLMTPKKVVEVPTPKLITLTLFGNMVIVDVIKLNKIIVNQYGT